MSRAAGSLSVVAALGGFNRLSITCCKVTSSVFLRNCSLLCTPGWPTTRATGKLGMPSPLDAAVASVIKPSPTSVDDGKPPASPDALARNTAGVQEPQHPMPEMTASTPISLNFCGSAATMARSLAPCVLPKFFQLTNLTVG